MIVNPNVVAPSQDFLKPSTVRFILSCFAERNLHDLPPTPIVRQDDRGEYVAIDGHNLLAVCSYLDEPVEVHLAKTADDGLPETSTANRTRNEELRQKFDVSLSERDRVKATGTATFTDLIARYPELFDVGEVPEQ